jgi:hypothetical protein
MILKNRQNLDHSIRPLVNRTLAAAFLAASCTSLSAVARAGTLDLHWTANDMPDLAGYVLHVGTEPGHYTRAVETQDNHATLTDLADNQLYFLRVEAIARVEDSRASRKRGGTRVTDGVVTLSQSAEISSLPRPEIESAGSLVPEGDGSMFRMSIFGRNFDSSAIVRIQNPSLSVVSTEQAPDGSLSVRLRFVPQSGQIGLPAVAAADVTVVNRGRKSPLYFDRNSAAADVDGDGRVSESDLAAVSALLGVSSAEARFDPAADLDGDGQITGDDLALLAARISPRGDDRPSAH